MGIDPTMDRRAFLRGSLIALGAAATLTACGDGGTAGPTAGTTGPKPTGGATGKVTYWDYYVTQAPWVDAEIKLFQDANPGITVEKTTQVSDRYNDLVSLAFRSDTAPDVFILPKTPPITEQVTNGWLHPLDEWADDQWRATFPDSSFVEGINVFEGATYSAPFSGRAPSLQVYVHNEIFRAAGLTNSDGSIKLPSTFDDLSNAAATIRSKLGDSVAPFGFGNSKNTILATWVDLLVRGAGSPGGYSPSGVDSMDYRVGKWVYDTDRNYADVVELILEWRDKQYFYSNSMSIDDEQARAFFAQGKFAMTIGGVWNQPGWTSANFTDYSLMTLPSPDGTPKARYYGQPGGRLYALNADSPNAEAAWNWFEWLHTLEAGERWVAGGFGLSAHPEANDPDNVDFAPFAAYVGMARYGLVGPQPTIRNAETSKVVLPAVKPDQHDTITGLYTGQLGDVQAALSELADRRNQALDQGIADAVAAGAKIGRDDYVFGDWDITKDYTTVASA